MKFGPIPTQNALGAILAHSADLPDGRMRKGKMLTKTDIARLKAHGCQRVTVAQLDPDDVHEDAAAAQLATAFVPGTAPLRLTQATTGRVNVIATAPGLFCCDAGAVDAVNAVDPMITIATLPQYKRVVAGDLVATIKIISYGVGTAALDQATSLAVPLRLRTAQHTAVTLIETQIGAENPALKGREAIAARVSRLGAKLTPRIITAHREEKLAEAIQEAAGTLTLILTASATSDTRDVAPQAVRDAGGRVLRFGMPVDPGNLLFLGECEGRPIIGLPGCARSLALNGADWVLERVVCGLPVQDINIAGMGVGGLLKESPARAHPRRSTSL